MSITHDEFLNKATGIILPVLESRSYLFSTPPLTRKSMIWFEKKPQSSDLIYRIVELQPGGFSQNEIVKVAVNLQRRSYRDYDNPPKDASIRKSDLFVRLSPRLWTKNSEDMDYWWNLGPSENLDGVFMDLVEKIIYFGVPFLESTSSSQENWLGKIT